MKVGNIAAHGLHDLLSGGLEQFFYAFIRLLGAAEIVGKKQWSCQTVPAAVGSSAVDAGSYRVFFITEQTDAVVKCS